MTKKLLAVAIVINFMTLGLLTMILSLSFGLSIKPVEKGAESRKVFVTQKRPDTCSLVLSSGEVLGCFRKENSLYTDAKVGDMITITTKTYAYPFLEPYSISEYELSRSGLRAGSIGSINAEIAAWDVSRER